MDDNENDPDELSIDDRIDAQRDLIRQSLDDGDSPMGVRHVMAIVSHVEERRNGKLGSRRDALWQLPR